MTSIVTREVLSVNELDRNKYDKRTRHVVSGVADLMWCAEVAVIEMKDQLKLIIVKSAELTEALLDILHDVLVLSVRRVRSDVAGLHRLVGRNV